MICFQPTKNARRYSLTVFLAGVEGLEPATPGFGDQCSSQLSYTPIAARFTIPRGRQKVNHCHTLLSPSLPLSAILEYMKSLSPSRPYVIFVIGKPGVGKTQFATKFSEMFGTPYIEADRIRGALTMEPDFSDHEQDQVNQLLTMQMTELFKTKTTFVVEGGTEDREVRLNLAKFAKDSGYESLFVWVQTDRTTAYARATKPSRQNAHKIFLYTHERYSQAEHTFMSPASSERPVVISGKHTPVAQIKTVLKRLALASRPKASSQLSVPARPATKPGSIRIS